METIYILKIIMVGEEFHYKCFNKWVKLQIIK
jgi:hypothetical protein